MTASAIGTSKHEIMLPTVLYCVNCVHRERCVLLHDNMLLMTVYSSLLLSPPVSSCLLFSSSPLGMGLLSNGGPPKWHPATDEIRLACSEAASYCRSVDVDISKLALHFALRETAIPTTLVSTTCTLNKGGSKRTLLYPTLCFD